MDDKETFPLFGRLITSELGLALPLIAYLKRRSVSHLGIVHWNDDYGNAYVRSLLQTATEVYPEMNIVSVDIPSHGASKTQRDYENAINTLAKTNFRWFFFLGDQADYESLMPYAVEKGIAGTGAHVWLINSASLVPYFEGLVLEKGSALADATRGVGLFAAQNGRPGMQVFDEFVEKWQKLGNERDIGFLNERLPRYTDLPDDNSPIFTPTVFQLDPSILASTIFDETVMLGLSACKAASEHGDEVYVDGSVMFQKIIETSFQGATGNVTLDARTGSRSPETAVFKIINVVEDEINETHVTFRVQDNGVFIDGQWMDANLYVYNDGTTNVPVDLPFVEKEENFIGRGLRGTGLVMAAFVVCASLFFGSWTIVERDVRVVRASQPIFLLILCVGTLLMGSAIAPLSLDDGIASKEACDTACMAVPWLGSLGFCLVFAALFSKTWRIHRIFSHPDMRRITLSASDVIAPLFVLTAAHLIVLGVWTKVSPLRWTREETAWDAFGRTIESKGHCTSDDHFPFILVVLVLDVGALLLASFESYQARHIATEFSESEYIGKSILCMLLVSSVGVPTMIIVSDDPRARYFATTSIIFVLCSAVLLFIFIPKVSVWLADERFDLNHAIGRSRAGSRIDGGRSTEDDDLTVQTGVLILRSPSYFANSETERLKSRIEELEQEVGTLRESQMANEQSPLTEIEEDATTEECK